MRRAIYEDDVIKLLDKGWKSGVYPVASNIHALPSAQPNLQPTCNQFATDAISRQEAIEALKGCTMHCATPDSYHIDFDDAVRRINMLPSAQPETNCSEIPNTSEFVSRKAVREMVATWSYDMAEWEDVELALSDVDKLPSAHPEVIHCKDCALWHRTGCPMNVFAEKPEPGYFCGTGRRKENE